MGAALRAEVAAYKYCTLDDTWIEAAHRDVSGISKKNTNCRIQVRLAAMRQSQNLAFLGSLAEDVQIYFYDVLWPHWRSIARSPSARSQRLRDCPRTPATHVHTTTYRLGAASRADWSASLKASQQQNNLFRPHVQAYQDLLEPPVQLC